MMFDLLGFFISDAPTVFFTLIKSGVSWATILCFATVIACCIYLYIHKRDYDLKYKNDEIWKLTLIKTMNDISIHQLEILKKQTENIEKIDILSHRVNKLEKKIVDK